MGRLSKESASSSTSLVYLQREWELETIFFTEMIILGRSGCYPLMLCSSKKKNAINSEIVPHISSRILAWGIYNCCINCMVKGAVLL